MAERMYIKLRKAKPADNDLLFRWVNDPKVRANSFDSKIVEYSDHNRWFKKKLADPACRIYICEVKCIPVGQIRVEKKADVGIITLSVEEKFRGQGIGVFMLEKIVSDIKNDGLNLFSLIGKIKSDNSVSQKAFMKAGYFKRESGAYVEFEKTI